MTTGKPEREKPERDSDKADVSVILENPYLRAVLDELFYLDAWKAGQISPISAAIRIRQIRNAKLIPAENE